MDPYQTTIDVLIQVTPAQGCQAFFILASSLIASIALLPTGIKGLLMDYGPRNPRATASKDGAVTPAAAEKRRSNEMSRHSGNIDAGWIGGAVSWLTSWFQIPHSWFSGFYVLSVALSGFWGAQYLNDGSVILLIAKQQAAKAASPSMTLGQVKLAWALMALQGLRRMYEQWRVMRPSKSKMWIAHWLLGIGFYTFTSVAVWVEGSWAIVNMEVKAIGLDDFTPKIILGLVGFLLGWINQYRCHRYLAGLRKYSLPDRGLFRYIVCAHYTCEILLYVSLAVVAAPEGQLCNRTLLCATILVSVNLGVTADRTKRWYVGKFGSEQVARRWRMIPLLY